MLLALCMFVIPFCQVLPALAFVLAVMGFNMGSVDTLANLQMISVFGEAVPPFLQVASYFHLSSPFSARKCGIVIQRRKLIA